MRVQINIAEILKEETKVNKKKSRISKLTVVISNMMNLNLTNDQMKRGRELLDQWILKHLMKL
jgi:hypothetical protein